MRTKLLAIAFTLFPLLIFSKNNVLFEENKNQWPEQVKYRVNVGNGATAYLEKTKFTFVKFNPAELEKIHSNSHDKKHQHAKTKETVHLHAFEMNFVNANPAVEISAQEKITSYSNYFIGNDPSRWASEVASYKVVDYKNLYPGIRLKAYEYSQQFKYDFIVGPGADPANIQLEFKGADRLTIKNNRLIIKTSTGDVIENAPYSYQIINDKTVEVACKYRLSADDKTVWFYFPNGYDKNYELTIDPVLVGATYSGGTGSTYGHCAAYDAAGNIYTGGESFDNDYPTTLGAFQVNFGGSVDISISKLNPDASNLIWATYIGGSSEEIPNSLFIPANGELYVLGASSSADYPVSAGCFDNTANGFTDITVTHLNAAGTALIGSTYVGGTQEDGGGFFLPWGINGHDVKRGEIIVDGSGNAWVASFTVSADFPATPGAYNTTLNGAGTYDACVFRLSPDMASLQWSSFLGGTTDEGAYGLRLNTAGELFVTGCTSSSDFPTSTGAYDQTFNPNLGLSFTDGFVACFNAAGTALISSTFYGTTNNEISYFIDLDGSGYPYIYGSSNGNMPVTSGVYSNPGSGNFIAKFNHTLTALEFATVFGDGSPMFLEPEAFMVDSCENIYVSGFGGYDSYPITPNALFPTQASANGGSCYFLVLSKDATSLLYASLYYGNHVDGGTSRFDPNGTIYQGICMEPGGGQTPAWAWSNSGSGFNYDIFVVKLAFELSGVNAIASAAPNDTICSGTAVNFINTSNGANYLWNFNDGSPVDSSTSPSHTFSGTGVFNVLFTAIDSESCNMIDTTHLTITVLPAPQVNLGNDTTICGTPNVVLDAGNANSYVWSTGASSQTINVNTTGNYWVTISNTVCTDKDTISIQALQQPDIGNDTSACDGQDIVLNAANPGATYTWSTGATTQTITVNTDGTYSITVTKASCQFSDTISVAFAPYPAADLGSDTILCTENTVTYNAQSPGATYTWSTGSSAASIDVTTSGTYYVTVTNSCSSATDTVNVEILACALNIPNVITPNGEGSAVNEYFYLKNLEYYPNTALTIYDRWGLKLFETGNYLNDWSGSKYSDGVYYYVLSGPKFNEPVSGFFHLMR